MASNSVQHVEFYRFKNRHLAKWLQDLESVSVASMDVWLVARQWILYRDVSRDS